MAPPTTSDPRLAGLPAFAGTTAVFILAADWRAALTLAPTGAAVHAAELPAWGPAGAPAAPPAPAARADLVVVAGVLRLVANPTALLDAALAALAPGGVLLLAEPLRAPTGPAATRHLAALDLGAAIEAARGRPHAPTFGRLQLGSLIQGYGLTDLGFLDALPGEPDPALAATWAARLAEAAADDALPADMRARAASLAAAIAAEGLAPAPTMRVWGRKPQ